MTFLLASLAAAGPIFLTAGDAVQLDVNGNWPRAFPAEDGWHVVNATQGEYHYQLVYDDLTTDRGSRRDLTGHADLQDHAFAPCPDGTYLHAASATHTDWNDSAYLFRYDADFNLIAEAEIADGDTSGMYADLPAVCGENYQGLGYWAEDDGVGMRFVAVDDDLNEIARYDLEDAPSALGSVLLEDDGILYAAGFYSKTAGNLLVSWYDADQELLGSVDMDITSDPWTGYWSQGLMRVGDTWLLAHMAEDSRYEWGTQGGDLWVTAFDLSWNLVDSMQLSRNTAPTGGMQPAFALKDDRLLVLYSYELNNWAWEVTLDLEAAGGQGGGDDTGDTGTPDDTGGEDTGTPDDTGSPDSGEEPDDGDDDPEGVAPIVTEPEGCGCASPGGAAPGLMAAAMAMMAIGRRRVR